jgi:hypothetical protein
MKIASFREMGGFYRVGWLREKVWLLEMGGHTVNDIIKSWWL